VLDGTEITPLDEEFVKAMRRHQDKTVVAVNKLDTEGRDDLLWDFYQLGIPRVVGVSAAHGRGIRDLIAAVLAVMSDNGAFEHPQGEAVIPTMRLAILGQPNTGKSTLVNRLTNSQDSLVSDVPGTTRDVIEGEFEWKDQCVRILDTAGIRRRSKVSENIEYYSVTRAIDTIDDAEVVVLLIDSEKGLSDQDKKIAGLVVDRGRGIILGLNKWDLLPELGNQFEAIKDRILFLFPVLSFAPILPLSARDGDGVPKLMDEVFRVRQQLYKRVDTGLLNRHLEKWLERTPPPVRGRGRLKVRYMTQVSTFPITFIAFVNKKKGFPESYLRYLKNQISADFGFTSVPFKLELRER
ncbi:MAG: ribosome biogenesis GTPase Der, partial [Spirochaetales bacterium]